MERRTGNSVLIVDGGGRAAALAHAYSRSPHVDRILVAPGNDFIYSSTLGKPVEIFPNIKTTDVKNISKLARERSVSLVDVAQDNAVEVGLVNKLQSLGIDVVGPTKEAGQIEWDKSWARNFGEEIDLPQPEFKTFNSARQGLEYLGNQPERRWFVKASGLVGGKGAFPAENNIEARIRIEEVFKIDSGCVLEEWLMNDDGTPGREFSAFIVSDGENFLSLGNGRDHKRLLDGDLGPNTGGMGVIAPVEDLSASVLEQADSIFQKTINGLKDMKRPYKGVLYLGGMVVIQNGVEKVYVIEFNARHGDPEAEAILPGITSDFYELGKAVASDDLGTLQIVRDSLYRVSVAGVAREYPGETLVEREIFGLEDARKIAKLYGAGIRIVGNRHYAKGGRLFYLVGEGIDLKSASHQAYEAMSRVSINDDGLHFRTDIGFKSA